MSKWLLTEWLEQHNGTAVDGETLLILMSYWQALRQEAELGEVASLGDDAVFASCHDEGIAFMPPDLEWRTDMSRPRKPQLEARRR